MNECNAIHETALGTVISVIDDVKKLSDGAKDGKEFAKKYKDRIKDNQGTFGPAGRSIARADSNLTMVFPILCSRGITIDNASMISKAMERHFVGMLQRIFAAYQLAKDQSVNSAEDFISQFHQNLDGRLISMDDILKLTEVTSEDVGFLTSTEEAAIRNDMSHINYVLPSNVNESSLSIYTFAENDIGVSGSKRGNSVDINIRVKNDGSSKQSAYKDIKDELDAKKAAAEFFNKQVPDSDYKKANELIPTSMTVSFKLKVGDNIVPIDNALIGVKAKLYPIPSEDIIDNVSKRLEDRNWITNFIRATTREISFFRDFLFAIDRAKIDALAHSARKKTTDKIWKVLERRATNAKIMKASQTRNSDVRPITTLCISQEEVEYLRKHHNVDMESISTVKALFNSLNLLAVVIVDESLEVAKFAFDSDDPMWETVSFTYLEREASDNSYKKVVNLMTKIAR